MRKKLSLISLVCLALFVGFAGRISEKVVINIPVDAVLAYAPSDLADLEKNSDAIVLAKVLSGAKTVLLHPEHPYSPGYTETKIEVIEVLSGNVSAGDILTITEGYHLKETSTEIKIYHYGNYNPSTPEKEYIFFLDKYDENSSIRYDGMYYPQGVEKGRYPILDGLIPSMIPESARLRNYSPQVDDFTNYELNLGELDSTDYREFFEDVVKKYQ